MFWDKAAGVYDLFGTIYNGKVNREMCRIVVEELSGEDRVLECACGTGLITVEASKKCREIIATDYSEGMLRQTKKKCRACSNVRVEAANILDLHFPDESFDAVIAANVIHLLDEPFKALSELDRVCRKGGKIIIPTYMNREKTGEASRFSTAVGKAGADFKQAFTLSSYKQFFGAAGYETVSYHMIEGRVPCAVAVIRKQ